VRKSVCAACRISQAVLLLLLILTSASIASAQTPLRQAKKFPIVIAKPGSYRLIENLEVKAGDAIQVTSPNVTIDLNGYAISGAVGGSSADGINAIGIQFVTVLNGTITGMGGAGIALGPNGTVKSMRISGNGGDGIDCGTNCTVADSNASSNHNNGIAASSDSEIRNCIANSNTTGVGIEVGPGSTVTGSTATGNFSGGINAGNHSVPCNCRIIGNVANNNSTGIFVGDSAVISGNMTAGNQSFGICGGKASTIAGNTSNDNLDQGIISFAGGTVIGNTVTGNQGVGIDFMDDSGTASYGQNVMLDNQGGDVSGGKSLSPGTTNLCSGTAC
jgi:parallel beta helix pectate lyase-like protein